MTSVIAVMEVGDRMSLAHKMFFLLKGHPEIRDSYDMIVIAFRDRYPDCTCKNSTLERVARQLQYDLCIFPPSPEVKRRRAVIKAEIIAGVRKNRGVIGWIKYFFKI